MGWLRSIREHEKTFWGPQLDLSNCVEDFGTAEKESEREAYVVHIHGDWGELIDAGVPQSGNHWISFRVRVPRASERARRNRVGV